MRGRCTTRCGSLLADPVALGEMARAARDAAAGAYSWDAVARRTLELYEALLAGGGGR